MIVDRASSYNGQSEFDNSGWFYRLFKLHTKDRWLKSTGGLTGPLDTAMVREVMSSPSTHPNILSSFEKMKTKEQLLTPDESAAKLVKLLKENKFKNGSHVDFFEVEWNSTTISLPSKAFLKWRSSPCVVCLVPIMNNFFESIGLLRLHFGFGLSRLD